MNKKYALITGASSGIGKATAYKFAANGINLILCARRMEKLEKIAEDILSEFSVKVLIKQVDVRNKTDVLAFANYLDQGNIIPYYLINNAGLASGKDKIYEGEYEDWDAMIDTNIKGLLHVTRTFLPKMVTLNEGHIINIGSTAGHVVYPEGNVYNATKFAVKALNEAINLDLVGTEIKCCSIDPGACETEFSIVRFHGDKERAKKVYEGYEPLHPEDIADAVWYVCNTPKHVNITNMVIYPTAQRNVFVIGKK
jgi:3-hydroxy acid dehydrogenase/malonic semialdehyde reductase